MLPDWLPELILLTRYNGDWDAYIDAVHEEFCRGFLREKLVYRGKRVGLKRHPLENGREATFWHMVSTGPVEDQRQIDLRRCERIAWPRAILDNCDDPCLKTWTEFYNKEPRIHIWCEAAEYLFVLADRGEYVLPWTAYPVTQLHMKKKLLKRWQANGGT